MQRDSAAHQHSPEAPANDARQSPLNRLLGKPAPEAPKPAAQPASVAAAPQGTPPSTPQPAPVPAAPHRTSPAAPQPAAPKQPQLSPAEMIVNKLRGKQAPMPLTRPVPPRAAAVVPEVTAEPEPAAASGQ